MNQSTVPLMSHVKPEVKALAVEQAKKNQRSLSKFVALIIEKALTEKSVNR